MKNFGRSTGTVFDQRVLNGNSIFELDALLPQQWRDRQQRSDELLPEKRLMLAVLEDAINLIQKHADAKSEHGQKLVWEALVWMRSDDPSLWTYWHICEVLGLDAGYLRKGVMKWMVDNTRTRALHELNADNPAPAKPIKQARKQHGMHGIGRSRAGVVNLESRRKASLYSFRGRCR